MWILDDLGRAYRSDFEENPQNVQAGWVNRIGIFHFVVDYMQLQKKSYCKGILRTSAFRSKKFSNTVLALYLDREMASINNVFRAQIVRSAPVEVQL